MIAGISRVSAVALAAAIAVLLGGSTPGRAQVALKAKGADLCLPCHAEMKDKLSAPHVHSALRAGGCESCHNPHAAKFPKLLTQKGSALCYQCHTKFKADLAKKKIVHRPAKDGECTACHDPHAGREKGMLTKAGGELCLTCHGNMPERARKVSHAPFKAGDCLLCHDPHASDQGGLLGRPSAEICQACHDLKDPKVKRVHDPFAMEKTACQQCHNPHGSDGKALAKSISHPPFAQGRCGSCHQMSSADPRKTVLQGQDLCLTCHPGIREALTKRAVHAPVNGGQCTACHTPHASEIKGLLADKERDVCLTCHQAVEDRWAASRSRHPEKAAEGRCTACHVAHSSDQLRLLAGDSLKVCSTCHGSHAAMSHPMGAGVMDPRTQKPITCLSCHDVHGSPLPSLLTFAKERELCVQCHRALKEN